MKQEIWQSEQPVLQADVARAQSTKEAAITERLNDEFNYGIVSDSQLFAETIPFAITVIASPYTASIATGVAYDNNGQRIIVNNASILYNAANVTLTTDNGIGGTSLTPASTGTLHVPLTASVVNYIYITYLNTIDPTVFTIAEFTNQRLFVSGTDGYRVDVVTNPGPAVGNPSLFQPFPSSIFLGVVDTTQTLTTTNRTIFTLKPDNLLAKVPLPTQTLNALALPYAANQEVNFPYHVQGLGTGTVTPTNVHGLSLADITGTFTGLTVNQMLQLFMESGFSSTTSQTSTVSALYAQVFPGAGSGPGPGFGYDNLEIKTFSASEALLVNGAVASLSTITQSYIFYFLNASGTPLSDGVYTVYLNATTMTLALAANGSPTNTGYGVQGLTTGSLVYSNTTPVATVTSNPNNFLLWQVDWIGSVPGPGNIVSTTDLRLFGTVDGNTLQRDALTNTVTIPRNLTVTGLITGKVTNLAGGAAGEVPYQSAPDVTNFTAPGVAGQVLTSTGSSAPIWANDPTGSMQSPTGGPWFGTPTGSRVAGTIYQNTTARAIFVNAFTTGGSTNASIAAVCDASATPTQLVALQQSPATPNPSFVGIHFIVPPTFHYQITTNSAPITVTEWQ